MALWCMIMQCPQMDDRLYTIRCFLEYFFFQCRGSMGVFWLVDEIAILDKFLSEGIILRSFI